MQFECATVSKAQLDEALAKAVRHPHSDVHKGRLVISPAAFETSGRETNLVISPFALFDCTGSIRIGPWCNIGPRSRIYTHDHLHMGRRPLSLLQEEYGVLWQDKDIGSDVWIHDGAMVLYQVTHIPDGVIVGGGSVLTQNPGPYEIWAGNPARKITDRTEVDDEDIREILLREGYSLDSDT